MEEDVVGVSRTFVMALQILAGKASTELSPDPWVSGPGFREFWGALGMSEGEDCLDLGGRLSGILFGHLLGFLLAQSGSLRTALETLGRHHDQMSTLSQPYLQPTGQGAVFVWQAHFNGGHTDLVAGFLTSIVDRLSWGRVRPYAIDLERSHPVTVAPYLRRLGVLPRFDRPMNGLYFHDRDLDAPLAPSHLELRGLLEWLTVSEGLGKRVSSRVRAILSRGVGESVLPTLPEVASLLSMGSSQLQRRLAQEGASFSGIVKEFRIQLASQALSSHRSISETARLLGYSETSAFTRAFINWTGVSPSAYQRGLETSVP